MPSLATKWRAPHDAALDRYHLLRGRVDINTLRDCWRLTVDTTNSSARVDLEQKLKRSTLRNRPVQPEKHGSEDRD